MRGKLIAFEGLDGSGKTTQIDLLQIWLARRNIRFWRTREPGGTDLGHVIRGLLLHRPDLNISPLAEAFLFQADRAQHFVTKIAPALDEGMLVVTDRFLDSSIVYQGVARGLGVELIKQISLIATGGLLPDLTIYLDLDPDVARQRSSQSDHFDHQPIEFYQLLRQAFLSLSEMKVVDAYDDPQVVHRRIVELVSPLLGNWGIDIL